MKDNFELIKTLIDFEEKNTFFFLQILKRKKDNPGQKEDTITIKILYIYSIDDLDRYKERIIKLCEENNARAYIGINRLDLVTIGLYTQKIIIECMIKKDYKSIRNAYESACGSNNQEGCKKWVIDIDEEILDRKKEILYIIDNLQKQVKKSDYKILAEVPTKTGLHIITNPFNIADFNDTLKAIAKDKNDPILHDIVKKNHPTVLYVS